MLWTALAALLLANGSAPESWPADLSIDVRARELLVEGKDETAFELVEKASEAGDPEAIDMLAWFHEAGRHVPVDAARAAQLYRRAADLGQPHAQWRLGVLIDEGRVKGSAADALELFRKSAAQDYGNAFVSLGVMLSEGRGTGRDPAGALACYEAAAMRGNAHAYNEIGVVHELGEGVEADPVEAAAYYLVAASLEDSDGEANLDRMIARMGDGALDAVSARARAIGLRNGLIEDEGDTFA